MYVTVCVGIPPFLMLPLALCSLSAYRRCSLRMRFPRLLPYSRHEEEEFVLLCPALSAGPMAGLSSGPRGGGALALARCRRSASSRVPGFCCLGLWLPLLPKLLLLQLPRNPSSLRTKFNSKCIQVQLQTVFGTARFCLCLYNLI